MIKTIPDTEIYHRRLQVQAYPGIARVISNHAYSYHDDWAQRHMVTSNSICVHRRMYSVQCSDKIHFPQLLRIKFGVAKSCPVIHTALQAPMEYTSTCV